MSTYELNKRQRISPWRLFYLLFLFLPNRRNSLRNGERNFGEENTMTFMLMLLPSQPFFKHKIPSAIMRSDSTNASARDDRKKARSIPSPKAMIAVSVRILRFGSGSLFLMIIPLRIMYLLHCMRKLGICYGFYADFSVFN